MTPLRLISSNRDKDEDVLRGIMSLHGLSYSPDLMRALEMARDIGMREGRAENSGGLE